MQSLLLAFLTSVSFQLCRSFIRVIVVDVVSCIDIFMITITTAVDVETHKQKISFFLFKTRPKCPQEEQYRTMVHVHVM